MRAAISAKSETWHGPRAASSPRPVKALVVWKLGANSESVLYQKKIDSSGLSFLGDSDNLALCVNESSTHRLSVVSISKRTMRHAPGMYARFDCVACNPEKSLIAANVEYGGSVVVFDAEKLSSPRVVLGERVAWESQSASPLSPFTARKPVRIPKQPSNLGPAPISRSNRRCSAIAWSPDGNQLAIASKTVELWDFSGSVASPVLKKEFTAGGTTGEFYGVTWSPDGERVAATTVSKIIIWDAASGGAQREIQSRGFRPKIYLESDGRSFGNDGKGYGASLQG